MNLELGKKVGWWWAMAHALGHPLLDGLAQAVAAHRGKPDLAEGVATAVGELQARLAGEGLAVQVDRLLGPQTWRAVLAHPESRAFNQAAWDAGPGGALEVAGVAIRMDVPGVVFRSLGRSRFRFRGYREGRAAVRAVVVHWGGLNVQHCFDVLDRPRADADGHLSTHLLAEHALRANGRLVVHQGVDLAHTAWHARGINSASVGIDICRSPRVAFLDRYPDGIVRVNATGRGDPEFVDLEPAHGAACRRAIEGVAALFDLAPGPYPGHAVLPSSAQVGILGHHHVSAHKWDVAPWAQHLWPQHPSAL